MNHEFENRTDDGLILSHLNTGYNNAQETIRALDNKSNILTALSVFVFTAVLGILKCTWEYYSGNIGALSEWLAYASMVQILHVSIFALSLLFNLCTGLSCIWACIASLTARGPNNNRVTILFPFIPYRPWTRKKETLINREEAKQYYDSIIAGKGHKHAIMEEYRNQIYNVALIQGKKIAWNRKAVFFFQWQIFSLLLILLSVTIISTHLVLYLH